MALLWRKLFLLLLLSSLALGKDYKKRSKTSSREGNEASVDDESVRIDDDYGGDEDMEGMDGDDEGPDEEGEDGYEEGGEGGEEEEEEGGEFAGGIPDIPLEKCFRNDNEEVHDVNKFVSWRKQTRDGRQIFALDRLLTSVQAASLLSLLKEKSTWLFFGYDKEERANSQFAPVNNAPWVARLSSNALMGTKLWMVVKKVAETLFPLDEDEYTIAGALGYVVRWGDHLTIDSGDKSTPGALTVMIYLDQWKRNHYGETLLLDTNTTVAAGIHPQLGRVAIFPTSVLRLMHPPAIDYTANQHIVELTLLPQNADEKLSEMSQKEQFHQMEADRRNTKAQDVFFQKHFRKEDTKDSSNLPDVKTLVKQSYVTDEGLRFMVFDGAFEQSDVDKLRKFILHHTSYHYDTSTDSSDNVKWVAGLEVNPFVNSRLFAEFQRLVNYFTGTDTYYPYDVSCNLIRAADHTLFHSDCGDGEKDVTIIIYLNPNWTENLHGETVFFRGNHLRAESITAVRPRYGRALIFNGTFLHSARPPSPTFPAARYTFAVKYAVTKETASGKDESTIALGFGAEEIEGEGAKDIPMSARVAHISRFIEEDLEGIANDMAVKMIREELASLKKRADKGESVTIKELKDIMEKVERLQSMEGVQGL